MKGENIRKFFRDEKDINEFLGWNVEFIEWKKICVNRFLWNFRIL